MRNTFSQTYRILNYLKARPNQDVPAIELHKAGSGHEYGFCASLSRRISDIRKLDFDVTVSRDEWTPDGQRHTWYRLTTP